MEVLSPKGFGRIRLKKVPDLSAMSLQSFIQEVVQEGTIVFTDEWPSYNRSSDHGYVHKRHILSGNGDPAHVLLPGPHLIAAL